MNGINLSCGIFSDSETENFERFELASAYFQEILSDQGKFLKKNNLHDIIPWMV